MYVHFLPSLIEQIEDTVRVWQKKGERSGWMDGVRGFEAISGQKLGGFRALWLPLFANLIESHTSHPCDWMPPARRMVLVGLCRRSHSMIEKLTCNVASNGGWFLQGGSSLRSIFQVEIYQPKIEFRYILPSPHKQIPDDLLDVSNQIKGQFSQLRPNEKLKFQSHLPLVVDNYPALHCWLEDKSWPSRWPSIKGCSRLPSCHLGWGSRPMDGPATRKNFQPKIQKQKSTWRLSREAFLTTLGRVKKP